MQNGIFFSIISLFYCILLCLTFYTKARVNTEETKIYGKLILINLVGLIIEVIPCTYAVRVLYSQNYALTCLILKSMLIYFIIWISEFTYYIFSISIKSDNDEKNKKHNNFFKSIRCVLDC